MNSGYTNIKFSVTVHNEGIIADITPKRFVDLVKSDKPCYFECPLLQVDFSLKGVLFPSIIKNEGIENYVMTGVINTGLTNESIAISLALLDGKVYFLNFPV